MTIQSVALHLSLIVGSVTFFGILIVCGKLGGRICSAANSLPCKDVVHFCVQLVQVLLPTILDMVIPWVLHFSGHHSFFADVLGIILAIAIGGADMPIVICILNT